VLDAYARVLVVFGLIYRVLVVHGLYHISVYVFGHSILILYMIVIQKNLRTCCFTGSHANLAHGHASMSLH
jgi:phosphotransferase system  glucose/maltose/N-acetylglucosamine-specific IIC component